MFDPNPTEPFFLIVADFDTGLFSVEGPMTDDGPWNLAAGRAREKQRRVVCGRWGRVVPIETLAREMGIKRAGLRQGELWARASDLRR